MSGVSHTTWEYRVETGVSAQELNALGRDGWELVAVEHGDFYLKRPGMSFKEQVTLDQRQRYFATRSSDAASETPA